MLKYDYSLKTEVFEIFGKLYRLQIKKIPIGMSKLFPLLQEFEAASGPNYGPTRTSGDPGCACVVHGYLLAVQQALELSK